MDQVECVVVGAGVVGLAVARSLALSGQEVMVLEAADAIGTGTSSRNSEVIHAGLYYPTGSLKARLCVSGREMLYAYAKERGVGHQRCGKLLVATHEQQRAGLQSIFERAQANGVTDLRWLDRREARALEPELECIAALHSPSTGIVDSHALMLALLGDLESAGGLLALKSPLALAQIKQDAIYLVAADGTRLTCNYLINAAGLNAQQLAKQITGLDTRHVPIVRFAKGNYFTLAGKPPFRHLIYPAPEAAGLGVHLTLDMGGQAKFGPDVQWVDSASDLLVDPTRAEAFYAEVRKYWPGLPDGALHPGYAGIRSKLHGPQEPAADFCIQGPSVHGIAGLVNLFGIESPGLTSSLAIGEYVAQMLRPQSRQSVD